MHNYEVTLVNGIFHLETNNFADVANSFGVQVPHVAKIRPKNDQSQGYRARRVAHFQRALLANREDRGEIHNERGLDPVEVDHESSQVQDHYQEEALR